MKLRLLRFAKLSPLVGHNARTKEIGRVYSARKVKSSILETSLTGRRPSSRENLSSRETRGECRGRAICQSYLARTAVCQREQLDRRTHRPDRRQRTRGRFPRDPLTSVARPAYDATSAAPMRDLSKRAVASDDDDWTGLASCPRNYVVTSSLARTDLGVLATTTDEKQTTLDSHQTLSLPPARTSLCREVQGATYRNLGPRVRAHRATRATRLVTLLACREYCDNNGVLNDRMSGCEGPGGRFHGDQNAISSRIDEDNERYTYAREISIDFLRDSLNIYIYLTDVFTLAWCI